MIIFVIKIMNVLINYIVHYKTKDKSLYIKKNNYKFKESENLKKHKKIKYSDFNDNIHYI